MLETGALLGPSPCKTQKRQIFDMENPGMDESIEMSTLESRHSSSRQHGVHKVGRR